MCYNSTQIPHSQDFFIKFELYQEHDPPLIPIDNNRLFFNVS